MTPLEFSTKLEAGDDLIVSQRLFKRLKYHTGQGTNRDGKVLGLVRNAKLANTLVAINGKYTAEDVTYAYFTDPQEAVPRVGVYLLAAKLAEPADAVASLDDQLADQLAALTPAQVADLLVAFTPPTATTS